MLLQVFSKFGSTSRNYSLYNIVNTAQILLIESFQMVFSSRLARPSFLFGGGGGGVGLNFFLLNLDTMLHFSLFEIPFYYYKSGTRVID
jgi:hypothetical protein